MKWTVNRVLVQGSNLLSNPKITDTMFVMLINFKEQKWNVKAMLLANIYHRWDEVYETMVDAVKKEGKIIDAGTARTLFKDCPKVLKYSRISEPMM